MEQGQVFRRATPEELKGVNGDEFLVRFRFDLGPRFAETEYAGDLIEALRSEARAHTGFLGTFLNHIAEHLEALAAVDGETNRPARLRERAELAENVTYFGHGSCPGEACLCQYGDDTWCEPC